MCFRGIYFPMMGKMAWVKMIVQNRKTIFKLVREGFQPGAWRGAPARIPLAAASRQDAGGAATPATGD
jgi:hypothetical protein